jgi:anti-sigma B factor antagonist
MEANPQGGTGFAVATTSTEGLTTVKVEGELDIATADQLSAELDALLVASGERVAVDLSGVGFMDSTGLRILIAANRKAGEAGYEFVVVTGASPARRVFELTRMDEHIRVVDSLTD